MNKKEQLNKMIELFDSELNFFKYLDYKLPSQTLSQYKKSKSVNKLYTAILKLKEKGYKVKLLVNELIG